MKDYDLIIVGTGPAGLTAAIYAARYKIKTLVLGKLFGGLATYAHKVCNYPGFSDISGTELMMKMVKQSMDLGVNVKQGEVLGVSKKEDKFVVKTKKEEYFGKKIILATGSERRKLGLDKEEELTGKGISYCATCDAAFFKDKITGVVGGGNSALTAALVLAKYSKKVYIIYRKSEFCKAEPAWIEQTEKEEKIEAVFNSNVIELLGEDKLSGVKLDSKKKIELDGLFVEVGSIPNTKIAEDLGCEIDCEFIRVNERKETSVKGVYSVGDVTNNVLKQIITACSDGAIAAESVFKDLNS